ncbi:urea transporter [Streptomyces sp. RS10V-4]|uniref:urea transporter n=1 Tax=Streptomyces rhizoryzae TaxID=2932493 RepID=UPI002002F835|nr:urea transporter [Streptomyces rhizoryzae]MCK7623169.1 urea transporter [Streptomyces rhizoryzae]
MHQPSTVQKGPAAKRFDLSATASGRFALEVLRGQAQVDFLPSALAGLVFTVALCAAGWEYGLYGLIGTAVGTGTARLLGVDRGRVTAGLEGFNACLVGVACAVFLDADHLSTLLIAVAAAAAVTVVTAAAARVLGTWGLPTFTLPFCLTATALTVAAPSFRHVWHLEGGLAALPGAPSGPTALSFTDLWHAFFTNIGEIFLMPQWYVGLIFLIGIFVADRRLGALACAGSAVAILTSWLLGAPADQVRQGLMGYDAVLVAMALGGVFLVTDVWSVGYALVGAVTSTVLSPALGALFAPSGGHAFTWPFVLVSLVFLVAAPAFPRLRRPE